MVANINSYGGTATKLLALLGTAAATYFMVTTLGRVKIGSASGPVGRAVISPDDDDDEQQQRNSDKVHGPHPKKRRQRQRRRLGFLERWYVAHSRAGMHTGFVVALELRGKAVDTNNNDANNALCLLWESGELKQRLERVSALFPWLRCKVRRDGVGLDTVDNRVCLIYDDHAKRPKIWGDDLYVEEEMERHQHCSVRHVVIPDDNERSFHDGLRHVLQQESIQEWHDEDPHQPMWRVTLVTNTSEGNSSTSTITETKGALVLAFHHLITDGMGALEVARAIVDSNYEPASNPELQQALPPPMEDLLDTTPTLHHMVRFLFWYTFPMLRTWFYPTHWKGNTTEHFHRAPATTTDRATELWCCPAPLIQDTSRLRNEYCRPNGVSLNSVLVATLIRAIVRVTSGNNSEPIVHLKLQVAADERRHRRRRQPTQQEVVPAHRLGSYVSGPHVHLAVKKTDSAKPSSIASLAREFQNRLRSALKVSTMDIGMCRFIDQDWIQFARTLADEQPNGVHDSLEVSLMNHVDSNMISRGDLRVDRLWFVQGRRGFASAVIVTTINTGTSLNAALSSFPDAVSTTQLEKIATAWKDELEALET